MLTAAHWQAPIALAGGEAPSGAPPGGGRGGAHPSPAPDPRGAGAPPPARRGLTEPVCGPAGAGRGAARPGASRRQGNASPLPVAGQAACGKGCSLAAEPQPGGRQRATVMDRTPIPVLTVQTSPYEDQRPTGGGGLRRPTALFESQRNYLPNFVQSLLSSVDLRDRQGCTMVVGSDGRYFSKTAIEIVVQMAAANGVSAPTPSPLPC